ncbi:MAG TPA: hypothetical protein VE871_19700 [Longimicrobium sp.]|nr:hypothetical protein [Longimicrobium sp.]
MTRRILSAALLVPLAACSDLFMDVERVPTSLVLADSVVTTVQGQRLQIPVTVLDQNGRAFDPLPKWAVPAWSTSSTGTIAAEGREIVALASGQDIATVQVAGLSASARVRVNPTQLRLSIESIQLTQAAQPEGGTAPLVRGRDAMLRVFMRGDRESFYAPTVRVRVYSGATLVETLTSAAVEVPVALDRQQAAKSWNVLIPARLVQPGLGVAVEADPAGVVPRAAGSTTVYPAGGAPLAADVRAVPPLLLRMIPVHQSSTGTTGAVNAGNMASFVEPLTAMFPVQQVEVDVRVPYTTSNTASTGTGWSSILREMAALQAADGSTRYYYGVVNSAGGGIAGIGYIGYPAALGWDRLPAGAQTMAHELGHNFGRYHAPCGGPQGTDPDFPTNNAVLDVVGWDVQSGTARWTGYSDLMSYCDPEWISWYTYRAVLDFRDEWDWPAPAQAAAAEPVLLVWGTVRDGEVVLEPAVELTARPRLPGRPGPFRIEAKDAAGATLYSVSFDGAEVADVPGGERHFAFTIPQRLMRMDRLASVRLTGNGRQATVTRAGGPVDTRVRPATPRFSIAAPARGRANVAWESARYPLTVVRDPRTGDILSFARGGATQVRTDAPELELLFSDGVRTTAQRVRVRQP